MGLQEIDEGTHEITIDQIESHDLNGYLAIGRLNWRVCIGYAQSTKPR